MMMTMMIESHSTTATATAGVRFSCANFDSSARLSSHSVAPAKRYGTCGGGRVKIRYGIKAAAKELSSSASASGSGSGSIRQIAKKPQRYHPLEELSESELSRNVEARLTPAENTRTIIEVNSNATLMFSGFVNEELYENFFWPDLPYVTDERGNIYFRVKSEEDILQSLTTEENIVQVIIGLDNREMINRMDTLSQSELDFGIDGLDEYNDFDDDEDDEHEDDSEDEDNYEKDWVVVLDEDDQDGDSDESLGDWAKLETMRSSHPIYFAQRLAEVVSDVPVDCMDKPSAGLAIQGLLRPAFVEEHSVDQKHINRPDSGYNDKSNIPLKQMEKGIVHTSRHIEEKELTQEKISLVEELEKDEKGLAQDKASLVEELEKDDNLGNGYVYYKLEMIKVQLVSANGDQNYVDTEDFRRARPDAIAHSAAKIISHLNAGGAKSIRALKSLCWRCKGIQVEECAVIGVDSLGFDLRVCSGRQVQTLRFPFKKLASSEYSAERQLNDLLFPRAQKFQQKKEAQQKES